MEYDINKKNYHDFKVFERGRLKPRSYFISYPDRASADSVSLREKRYASPKALSLNGSWDFRFYRNPQELPDRLDTAKVQFEEIDVPSCWQFRGWLKPFYLNTRYQFPYNPPAVPKEKALGRIFSWIGADKGIRPRFDLPCKEYNSVGVYRKLFKVGADNTRKVISFLGAASCLDLYVNGHFVGYSEGSHNTAEFDITSRVREGENEMLAVVHRWCSGSYLEAQDMFRNNGIFRDVILYEMMDSDPWEIEVGTEKKERGYELCVKVVFNHAGDGTKATLLLLGEGLSQKAEGESRANELHFEMKELNVLEWNAENPVLYNLYLETETSCTKLRIGFRDVRISGTHFKLNGRLIKLHGINHHDTGPVNGWTMSPEEIERDVKLCKEYNIDTIRTAHYPPDPYLLELCDELGIYVVDEADIETHGSWSMALPPDYNRISNDARWGPRFVDRVSRLYERDKNHPSIILWSLGNESGGTACTDMEEAYLKKRTSIPLHYEGAIHTARKAYDVGSQMYPSVSQVHEVGEKRSRIRQLNDRPYFLCEYAHAMGTGPGNIEDYWKEIYKYDNLMGGCIWEMADHAVLEEDGNYTYGGDHGEYIHDGNFCADGIFYPDRTPSTGAFITKFTYRPLRIRYLYGSTFEIFNTTGFTEGKCFEMKLSWSDGRSLVFSPDVGPMKKVRLELQPDTEAPADFIPLRGGLLLTALTIDKRNGRVASVEQITIRQNDYVLPVGGISGIGEAKFPAEIKIRDKRLWFDFGTVRFAAGFPGTILYRAATDNDVDPMMRGTMTPYYEETEELLSEQREGNRVTIRSRIRVGDMEFLVTDVYESANEGLMVTSILHPVSGRGEIPRFGKTYRLMNSFQKVIYEGRAGESYADMKDQFPIARVSSRVSKMVEPNIRPQESGNRCDVSWASFSNEKNYVIFEAVGSPFELSVKPYTDAALIRMKHRGDEDATGVYVTVNAFQRGIGTGSCGPSAAERFTYQADRDYTLTYLIRVR
ncbi:MAG: hypothetical protein K6E30_05670 [Lachnospiraceae bacterium]|nr:hypothetical protein [Lachnospiraceae bacterium]